MEFTKGCHFLHSLFLFLPGMLFIFSEGVEFFPVDFLGNVFLEIYWIFCGECFSDLAKWTSEDFCFFWVYVTTFFAGHSDSRMCVFKFIML